MKAVRVTIEVADTVDGLDGGEKFGMVYPMVQTLRVGSIGEAVEAALTRNIPDYNGQYEAMVPAKVPPVDERVPFNATWATGSEMALPTLHEVILAKDETDARAAWNRKHGGSSHVLFGVSPARRADESTCSNCGGKDYHHTVDCYTEQHQ